MASYPSSSHYPDYASSSTELSLSSSAQALYFASKPRSRPQSSQYSSTSREMQLQQQQPSSSHWEDTTDDDRSGSGRWDDGPEQSRWSSATGSQRASRLSSSSRGNSYSRSKFSDEDTSAYGSDEDRYGPPDDAKQRGSGYSSDKGDRASLSGASSYATAATSADQLDSSSLLDDRPQRFYRQSAREAEAYRHLSAARRPSPIPTDLPRSPPPPPRSPLPQYAAAAAPALAPSSPSPATSPTLPLNIIKKTGTSPASPNFGPIPVPQPPLNLGALNGMTSATSPPTDANTFLSSSHPPPSDSAPGGARASNAASSTGTRSSNAYSSSSGAGGVYRTSTLSQAPVQHARSSNIPPPQMQRQPSSDHFAQQRQHQQPQQYAQRRISVDSEYSDAASQPDHEQEQDHEQDEKTAGSVSDDDNVPLAQRLPNALKAQQSIRAKDKQDRQRRRAERAARKATATAAMPALPVSVPVQRAVSAPMQQAAPPNASGSLQRQRQASQPLSSASASASAFSPPRAIKTLPPAQHQLGSIGATPDFADDLTRRLAQVQSSASAGPEDGGAHFGVALALDNTGAAFPRSPPATQGAFPAAVHRAPPPDAFRSHAELQLRRQSSQPHLARHSRLSSRSSIDPREREPPPMRPPSPGANPDAKLRAYAAGGSATLSRAGSVSVSARGTFVIPPPRPESRSRPPSPTHPPLPQAISQPQPIQPTRSLHSRAASPSRRPTTADGERHRPSELRRPMTADRDAEPPRPFGAAMSRPGSPVLRPPSPSMSSLTPDERLKQLAMSRRRTVSVSQQQQQPRPAEAMPAVPLIPLDRMSPPAQEIPASPRPGAQERVAFPAPPNGVLSQSLSRATATPAHKDAALGIRPPSPSMATLTPDERLRQIAMSRGRGPAPAPAQPSATPSAMPFRKRAMSLGRPSAKEEAAPARSKTLLSKSRGAHSAAVPMPPIPQSPLPPTVKMSQNQRPVIVTDAMGATQQVLAADVAPATRAKDVLAQLASQLPTGSVQGWMLYEICNDLGLEHPIREFELVAECCARWPAEGNTFAVRQTRLSRSLAQSAIPSVAPLHGAYVEFEVKRGKWSKKWLELRDNCLWVSKKEHAKDAAFLCSLSNFDVYSATRSTVKPPRYAFTLRSTDDLSMFENPADSVHSFCSPDAREGERWIEHIMVARSCVLFQERTVLFRSRDQAPTSSSANPRSRPPAAPLLNVRALAQAAGVLSPSPISASSPRVPDMRFEPGSLLARAAAAERV